MEATILFTPDLEGAAGAQLSGKADVITLREETAGGAKSILVRLHAGGEIVPHAHVAPVQHFVLGGRCEYGDEAFGSGTYLLFASHSSIPRISSSEGAEVLIIVDPEPA